MNGLFLLAHLLWLPGITQTQAFRDLSIAVRTGSWGLVCAVFAIVFLVATIIANSVCKILTQIYEGLGDDER